MQATRATIHLENLRHNLGAARRIAGTHPKICFPVKADAYGHGAVALSKFALGAGADYLAVARVSEGVELRVAGIKAPILVLSQALPEELKSIVAHDLAPLVSDEDFTMEAAKVAEQERKQLNVHLKIDSGMGRLGCKPEDAASLAGKIASCKQLHLEGVATHLSVSDSQEADDVAYTREQISRFKEAVASIKDAGFDPGIVHAANSGALLFHENSYFDMVRPGIFLYGYTPFGSMQLVNGSSPVKPIMELRSKVTLIKRLKKGEAISYGRTWVTKEDTFIGVIPAGYADGLPRGLSNNHSVQILGKEYPLVGRVCMDNSMVNLGSETEVKRWDDVVIFGPGFLNAADLAGKLNTIPYEITCGITKRVIREYVG